MPATILWFLFDWRGRLGAPAYRRSIFALGATVAGLEFIPFRSPYFLLGLVSAQILVQASLDAKRLHDLGKSAVWVFVTTGVCVGGVAWLFMAMPDIAGVLTDKMAESVGPLAKNPAICIAFAGIALAAALRSVVLSWGGPSEAGAIYDHDPIARRLEAVTAESEKSRLDADALIAKALEDRRLQEAAAAMRQAAAEGRAFSPRAGGLQSARKSFGRRSG